jgi:hypothetical protein
MKTIKQDELFQNLGDFLKRKGVELKEGNYAHRIRQGCGLLTDAINATQTTVKHAGAKVDRKLEQLRQCIHKATAPKPPPGSATARTAPASPSKRQKSGSNSTKSSAPGKPRRRT